VDACLLLQVPACACGRLLAHALGLSASREGLHTGLHTGGRAHVHACVHMRTCLCANACVHAPLDRSLCAHLSQHKHSSLPHAQASGRKTRRTTQAHEPAQPALSPSPPQQQQQGAEQAEGSASPLPLHQQQQQQQQAQGPSSNRIQDVTDAATQVRSSSGADYK